MPEEYIEIIEMWKNRKIAEREETVLTRGKTPVLTRGKTVRKKPTCNDKVIHDVFWYAAFIMDYIDNKLLRHQISTSDPTKYYVQLLLL